MNKKKILIILTIMLTTLLVTGCNNITKKDSNQQDDNKIKFEDPTTITGDRKDDPDIIVAAELVNLSKQVFPNDKEINVNNQNEMFISLKEFRETYNLDISKFDTFELVCDEEKAGINFIKQDDEIIRMPILSCSPRQ